MSNREDEMEPDWWARALAVVALAYAGWNHYINFRKTATRLKVIANMRLATGSTKTYLESIRVENLSEFEVNIAEIGVITRQGSRIILPTSVRGSSEGFCIRARDSYTALVNTHVITRSVSGTVAYCFVKPEVGKIIKVRIRNSIKSRLN